MNYKNRKQDKNIELNETKCTKIIIQYQYNPLYVCRFILDNPLEVEDKTVLEVGCGSGACAIAAVMSKAKAVIANDTDKS